MEKTAGFQPLPLNSKKNRTGDERPSSNDKNLFCLRLCRNVTAPFLTLDSTRNDTLDDAFLCRGIENDDGDDGENEHCHKRTHIA